MKNEKEFEKIAAFDEVFPDGRMTVSGKPMRDFHGAVELQKKLNRPLNEEEVKEFE